MDELIQTNRKWFQGERVSDVSECKVGKTNIKHVPNHNMFLDAD